MPDREPPTLSRFTHPGDLGHLLDGLPDDPVEICEIARSQTIHHNLLPYFGVPRDRWQRLARVWPPRLHDILRALEEVPPHALLTTREPEQRVVGACILESHLLAGMLRRKRIRVRIRAGYFQNVRANSDHVVRFWERVMRERRVLPELLQRDPDAWRDAMNAYTRRKNKIDHHIEHWVCEYWYEDEREWKLLDANDTFLEAHGGLAVGFHLPRRHFEFAHEAWRRIRIDAHDPDRYAEEPQDGRSHVRSQLLWDYYSLLNHDIAGVDAGDGGDHEFVKGRAWDDLSDTELEELDRLADLLAGDPRTEELVAFYWATPGLRIAGAEQDPHSFVARSGD